MAQEEIKNTTKKKPTNNTNKRKTTNNNSRQRTTTKNKNTAAKKTNTKTTTNRTTTTKQTVKNTQTTNKPKIESSKLNKTKVVNTIDIRVQKSEQQKQEEKKINAENYKAAIAREEQAKKNQARQVQEEQAKKNPTTQVQTEEPKQIKEISGKTLVNKRLNNMISEIDEELSKVEQKTIKKEQPKKQEVEYTPIVEIEKTKELKLEKPIVEEQPKVEEKTVERKIEELKEEKVEVKKTELPKKEEKTTTKTKKKKLKVFTFIKVPLILVNLIITILLFLYIVKLDMLPTKFLLLGAGALLLVNLIMDGLLLLKNWFFRILGILLSILLITGSVIGVKYIGETNEFLDTSFNNNTIEISSYDIVVLSESTYTKYEDLKRKRIGYLAEEPRAIEKLQESLQITTKEYVDTFEMYNELIAKKIDAMVIDQSLLEVIKEEQLDVDKYIKTIYTFNLETIIENKVLETDKLFRPITIYVSGSDSRGNTIANKSRSDVNMLVTINPYTNEILLTSVPRDYYVQVHGQTGLKDKLTHAGIYGLDRSAKTMGDLFDIEVDYSVKVGFNAVEEVVDLVGGIDVYSDTGFYSYHIPGWYVKKGNNHFNGKQALAYARERYAYASGDRHRIQNQQQVLEAVLKKAMTNKELLLKYDKLLSTLGKLYRTDIPKEVISEFVKDQVNDMDKWTIEKQTVDGKGASLPTYTAPKYKRYVMIPYEEDVQKASTKIKEVLERE